MLNIFLVLIILFSHLGCSLSPGKKDFKQRSIESSKKTQPEIDIKNHPVVTITPTDIYKAYPPHKKNDEKMFISAYDIDVKYRKLAIIEVITTFKANKKEILHILINEAKKIGADGIINIRYGTVKETISDFKTINKRLQIPVKIYKPMMRTDADAIVF